MSRLGSVDLTLVESYDEVQSLMRWLGERRPILGVDIETSGLSLAHDRVRLVQFGDARHGWAIPYDEWRGVVRHILDVYEGKIVLHQAKFDASFLLRDGLTFPWERTHDTYIMSFLVDSLGPRGLKPAAALYVDPAARAGEAELKKAMTQNRWGYHDVPITHPLYWSYAALDTSITALLAETLWPRVQAYRAAYDLEMACQRVLCDMEMRGVAIDVEYCDVQRARLLIRLEELQAELGGVNFSASAQVAAAVKAEGYELRKLTPTGLPSVEDDVLKILVEAGSRTATLVLEARSTQKLLSAYFENFLGFHADGVLHPHINQLAARTGRMSVTEPALQQVPRKALVRDAFVPREGNRLLLVDYDNEELRVAAHFSKDPTMLKAFTEGRSLHDETAARLYGPSYTRAQRSTAKNAMFAKAYGAGVAKFAATARIPTHEAAQVFSTLDTLYPGLNKTMAAVTSVVRQRSGQDGFGYVQLTDGRRLRVRGDKAYVGFNALIQGSCAVVLKQALVDLDAVGLGAYLALPIHDEVMFDVPIDDLEEVREEVTRVMTREDFTVPLTVQAKVVERWGEPYRV
jgi:DNA polymerase-1